MLPNTDLLASLWVLDGLYAASSGRPPDEQLRICKYGVLELCGWIEEAQDFVVNGCAAKLSDQDLKDIINERVRRNYGFDADSHFLPLLGLVIGLHNYEAIRANLILTAPMFDPAMQALSTLKVPRNTHAHTHFTASNQAANLHLSGRQPRILIQEANKIHSGLCALEGALIAEGFM
jgi:hypothetical protein